MLDPESSVTLLEALEPPDGFALDVAVGTTFTLDLRALLAVPTGFAIRHPQGGASECSSTPLELLEALRAYAGRITVFTDAAHIAVPPSTGSGVFGFLERCVVPVTAPKGGAFHPKFWTIRFADDDGAIRHRVLVASRNLTFDRSWDTIALLDEQEHGVALPGSGAVVRSLLRLPERHSSMEAAKKSQLRGLARSVAAARFAPPEGFDALQLHAIGFDNDQPGAPWPFPPKSARALVVSPFLAAGTLGRISSTSGALAVVSRAEELDRVYAASAVSARPESFEINPHLIDAPDEVGQLSGLHAKVLVFDVSEGRSAVFCGSANATDAAFSRNTEVMLEMSGLRHRIGTDRWMRPDIPSLRQILEPHLWNDPPAEPPEDERSLRRVQSAIAGLRTNCTVTKAGAGLWHAEFRSEKALPDLGRATLEARTLSESTWSHVPGPHLAHTASTNLAGLTTFLALRLSLPGHGVEFAIACPAEGIPDSREERLLADLIESPGRLVRYLLMLLTDQPEDRFDGAAQATSLAVARRGVGLESVPLLEVMIRTAARHPGRLRPVAGLMDAVRRSQELAPVHEDLLDLWDSVQAAVATEEGS